MTAKELARVQDNGFDRETWAALWDRLPEGSARRAAITFILQQLHAIESGGRFSIRWDYDTNAERDSSATETDDGDQPGDEITFKGVVQIGWRSIDTERS